MKTIGEDYHTSGSANTKGNLHLTNLLHPGEDDMNMNLDDPYDHRVLNTEIKNYVMAEFVAIPPDFDLQSHLSMREHVGIYEVKNMNTHQAQIFVDSIKNTAVFCSMNNALINPNISFFVLQLFQDLNLVLKSVDNPMRRGMSKDVYMDWAKRWETGRHNYIRGQEVMRISFLIVNVVHLFQEDVYKEAMKAMEEVHKFQQEINSMDFKLD